VAHSKGVIFRRFCECQSDAPSHVGSEQRGSLQVASLVCLLHNRDVSETTHSGRRPVSVMTDRG